MADKILTKHPDGKNGVNIDAGKYKTVRDTITSILKEHPEITYQEMNKLVIERLKGHFEGSISWYVVTVKLDMEARGIIERIPKTSPHRIRLKN
jgi:lipoate-protein ligase A